MLPPRSRVRDARVYADETDAAVRVRFPFPRRLAHPIPFQRGLQRISRSWIAKLPPSLPTLRFRGVSGDSRTDV